MRTPIKPIRWGAREAALLTALLERAAAEGMDALTFAEAVRVAMAVAVEAGTGAWRKARKT